MASKAGSADPERVEQALLWLLAESYPVWWLADELVRAVAREQRSFAEQASIRVALRELTAAGVAHCRGGFYCLTRAAKRTLELADLTCGGARFVQCIAAALAVARSFRLAP
jgi:hypothetical protein